MTHTILPVLLALLSLPLGFIVAGFIYDKVVGMDEVQTVEDAVAEAHERRNDE